MRIYKMARPHPPLDFAWFGVLGGMKALGPSPAPPDMMTLEWEPGSDMVGDFSWFFGQLVVTEWVVVALSDRFTGFSFFPIQMHQDSKLKRPSRVTKHTHPRVWLPYDGPELSELWVTCWVHCDLERSSVRLTREVAGIIADTPGYHADGVERVESWYDREQAELRYRRTPRQSGKGLLIPDAALDGADIFRAFEQPGAILCTERVREFILEQHFSNIDFLEYGDTVQPNEPSSRAGRSATISEPGC